MQVCSHAQVGKTSPQSAYARRLDSFKASVYNKTYLPFTLKLQDGREVTNESLLGKVVMLDFWFEFCHPCHADFSSLNSLDSMLKNRSDFQLVAVARESVSRVPELIAKYGLKYPIAAAEDTICRKLNFGSGFPVKILLDKKGQVRYYAEGGTTDSEKTRAAMMNVVYPKIQELLAE